jgi:sugar/nucleoside kinase (ribokinase family)
MSSEHPDLIVVGSIGIDTIETPHTRREEILGGSASYACVAASFFSTVGMVGVVGTDFPDEYEKLYRDFDVDLAGLQKEEGKTFRWSGVYEENMDERRTLSTDLNVFEHFSPDLPEAYRDAPFVFLANISPNLQLHVLDQVSEPKFVMADTMDLWINVTRPDLDKLIQRVDMITVNESEARHYTDEHSLIKAAQMMLDMGPKYVLIKKGEHGSLLFSKDGMFLLPAFPVEDVNDPTGAGDTFAGAFMGALAAAGEPNDQHIRRAMLTGSVVAAFGVQDFSLDRLAKLERAEIDGRCELFRKMLQI